MQAYVTLILHQVIGMYCPNSLTVWLLSISVSGFLKLLSNTLLKKKKLDQLRKLCMICSIMVKVEWNNSYQKSFLVPLFCFDWHMSSLWIQFNQIQWFQSLKNFNTLSFHVYFHSEGEKES